MSSLRRSRHRRDTCDALARTLGSSMNDRIYLLHVSLGPEMRFQITLDSKDLP